MDLRPSAAARVRRGANAASIPARPRTVPLQPGSRSAAESPRAASAWTAAATGASHVEPGWRNAAAAPHPRLVPRRERRAAGRRRVARSATLRRPLPPRHARSRNRPTRRARAERSAGSSVEKSKTKRHDGNANRMDPERPAGALTAARCERVVREECSLRDAAAGLGGKIDQNARGGEKKSSGADATCTGRMDNGRAIARRSSTPARAFELLFHSPHPLTSSVDARTPISIGHPAPHSPFACLLSLGKLSVPCEKAPRANCTRARKKRATPGKSTHCPAQPAAFDHPTAPPLRIETILLRIGDGLMQNKRATESEATGSGNWLQPAVGAAGSGAKVGPADRLHRRPARAMALAALRRRSRSQVNDRTAAKRKQVGEGQMEKGGNGGRNV